MCRDPILLAAVLAAIVSAFFVPPSWSFINNVDFHVLALLLALMLVVSGLQGAGVFDFLVEHLLNLVHNTRTLTAVLVGICFFSSMLITNDVALITFVPLAVIILTQTQKQQLLIPVMSLQTVAANLGSMFTPLGNPQNLYLYSLFNMGAGEFFRVMALPTALSFMLLTVAVFFIRPTPLKSIEQAKTFPKVKSVIPWAIMFVICLLAVLRVVPSSAALAAAVLAALIFDRTILRRADYGLLVTFTFLFIFIGNIKSIPAVSEALSAVIQGHELTVGILLSQAISNVPAAMLLSGFTNSYTDLLVGVNLGGLGTLIASMASVISYKLYTKTYEARKGRYLAVFTGINLLFLIVLWGTALLI